MKKKIIALLAIFLCVCFAACSDESASEDLAQEGSSPVEEQPEEAEEIDLIHVSISDLQSNLNQWHRYALDVSHANTGKYLNAEVYGAILDAEGTVLGETTVFVNNLGAEPTDWLSEPFLAKMTEEPYAHWEVVSYEFTDGYTPMPEVTDENVGDYIRFTSEYLGDVVGGDMEVTVDVHNLTPEYFTGSVTIVAKDTASNIIETHTEQLSNVKPFGDHTVVVWVPITEEYSLEYSIDTYSFSENPS